MVTPMQCFRDPQILLFVALLLLHLVPLWAVPCFPSQDGPTHLENAVILRDYDRPDRPLLREYYVLNTRFDPNWFGHLALRGLLAVFPVLTAEKVFLSGYVLLFPLAVRYALEGTRPGAGYLAVLAFPFVHHFLYHMGFYNFCYSLAGWFLVVGYGLRHEGRFGLRQTAVLAALVVLLYFCHLVAVVMALMTIGTLEAVGFLADRRRKSPTGPAASLRSRLLPLAAFLPAIGLGLAFVGRQGTAAASELSLATLARWLRQMQVLVSYLPLEQLVAEVFFWGLVVLAGAVLLARFRHLERRDALLLVVGLALLAYFLAPSSLAGGSFVNTRLSLFPCFALILWLGTHPFGRTARWLIQGGAALVALALLALHGLAAVACNDYLREYLSVEAELQPNRTLLPLTFSRAISDPALASAKVGVFRHASGYLAARVGVVELENYEATTGYFPVVFREERNPFVHLSPEGRGTDIGLQAEPPRVDIAGYEQRTGLTIDDVLLWNVRPEQREGPAARDIFRQLEANYDLVFTSSPRGLLQLYRRRER